MCCLIQVLTIWMQTVSKFLSEVAPSKSADPCF